MVVPLFLRADDGNVELLVQRGHGNIKAVHFLAQPVGVGNRVRRGLQERRAVLARVLRRAAEEILNALRRQADVNAHLPVLDRQRSLALADLVHMEHAAVGIKFRSVHAVGERRLCRELRCIFSVFFTAACQKRTQQQYRERDRRYFFHLQFLQFVLSKRLRSGTCPLRSPFCPFYAFRESMAACVCAM